MEQGKTNQENIVVFALFVGILHFIGMGGGEKRQESMERGMGMKCRK